MADWIASRRRRVPWIASENQKGSPRARRERWTAKSDGFHSYSLVVGRRAGRRGSRLLGVHLAREPSGSR